MLLKDEVFKHAKKALEAKSAFMLSLPKPIERVKDRGFEFIFSYYDTTVNQTSTFPPKPRPKEPLLPPYDEHLEVCHMTENGSSHYVFVNKFMATFGHIVMSTDRKGPTQGEPLSSSDTSTMASVINGFGGSGLCLYNSGVESGCTQLHKHMQYVPTDDNPILESMLAKENLPFKYYCSKMSDITSEEIMENYRKLMSDANYNGSYNYMIFKKHGFLVPRSHARHPSGKVINALGVAGHWTIFERMANTIIKQHPMTVLEELCVKK